MNELIIFTIGLFIGSFLNSVVFRLEKGEEIVFGRSHCPDCGHTLSFLDLAPVLSFIALKGKCRYCGKRISSQYPLVELATAFLLTLSFSLMNHESGIINYESYFHLAIIPFLIVIFVYDLKHYIIPDKIIYPAIAVAIIWCLISALNTQYLPAGRQALYAAIVAAGFFAIIHFASKGRWMGFGDVKLAFLMGLLLGFPGIVVALFCSFFLGAIIGTALIIFGKKKWKSEVPFGPFLIIGLFIALFWGRELLDSYLGLFAVI